MIENPKNLSEQICNLVERIATELRVIVNTLQTKLGKTEKAVSAGTADSATKATQDANGNVITTTYATKTEMNECLNATKSQSFTTAQMTQLRTNAGLGSISTLNSINTSNIANNAVTANKLASTILLGTID